jgi:hypothetical protein
MSRSSAEEFAVPEFEEHQGVRSETGLTITATLDDGPRAGSRIEFGMIEGRPPKTIEVKDEDGTPCRYCLKEWEQGGASAEYTFLYRV